MVVDQKLSVLVVDDREENRLAFRLLLEQEGFHVVTAARGLQAVDIASGTSFAVILLDVRMPGLDGFDTASLLRKQDRTRQTPIIFISAYEHAPIHVLKGYKAGATDYIVSPVDEKVLIFKVKAYADLSRSTQELKDRIAKMRKVIRALCEEIEQHPLPLENVRRNMQEMEQNLRTVEELSRQD